MSDTTTQQVEDYLEKHQQKELLRLVVVGSVDDGKSTLIGRLLHDTQGVYEDQLAAVKKASSQGGMEIDFSLFTDGLKAEREQGITIDVAYRYCTTDRRKFIIADTPGHVQYTRNMATGASTANVAMILIDARLGVLQQSRRHAYIASLLGIPHLTVAVNKMDLKDYDQSVFDKIVADFRAFSKGLSFKEITFIPVSALAGDNVVDASTNTPWYDGPTILAHLETVPIAADHNTKNFRYPVQYVLRPHLNYRGFAGQITSGTVRQGDEVMVLPSRKRTRVKSIDTFEGSIAEACSPLSVALTLEDEVDISRGDMLVHPHDLPSDGNRFRASIVWMNERALDPRKSYLLKHTAQRVRVEIESVQGRLDLETLTETPADTLELNDIGTLRLRSHKPLYFDPYSKNRGTGAFILIDSLTNTTVAAGMIQSAASPESVAPGQFSDRSQVSPSEREERLGQRGSVIVLCGLPGAGKTQLAYAVERILYDRGGVAMVVDREDSLSNPATDQDPATVPAASLETARRVAQLGGTVLLPYACPNAGNREAMISSIGDTPSLLVYVDATAETRSKFAKQFYSAHPEPRFDPLPEQTLRVTPSKEGLEESAGRIVDAVQALFATSN